MHGVFFSGKILATLLRHDFASRANFNHAKHGTSHFLAKLGDSIMLFKPFFLRGVNNEQHS